MKRSNLKIIIPIIINYIFKCVIRTLGPDGVMKLPQNLRLLYRRLSITPTKECIKYKLSLIVLLSKKLWHDFILLFS